MNRSRGFISLVGLAIAGLVLATALIGYRVHLVATESSDRAADLQGQLAMQNLKVNSLGSGGAQQAQSSAAAASTLSGTTLAANVVSSSLTSVGTIATGVWNGTGVTVPFGGTGVATLGASQLLYGNGSGAVATVATSSLGVGAGLTNTGTLGSQVGGSALTLKQVENRNFSLASSTWGSGTTTLAIEVGYGEVWNNIQCFTDAGTLNVDFYYNSTHMTNTVDINASSTVGINSSFSNSTPTASSKVQVDIGTAASSPTKLVCKVNDTI